MSEKNPYFDISFVGGTLVTPAGPIEAGVGIRDGKIAAIGDINTSKSKKVVECKGLHIFPGVIDSQVHFREPGLTHKEDLESGMRSAIAGGVTTIFEMPNTNPLTLTEETFAEKLKIASENAYSNYAFYMGGSPTNIENLNTLELIEGCCGVKVFMGASTGDLLTDKDMHLRKILQNGRRRVAVHAEDNDRLKARQQLFSGTDDVKMHPTIRDEETALKATQRIIKLARETGRPTHILHITTAEELSFISDHKDLITAEATPQHLTLFAPECYEVLGSRAQMNPPIRSREHRAALWKAVNNGTIDVIGSDHAPHTLEEKSQPYPKSPSGMPGVQTLVPIMLHHVNKGRLSLMRALDLMCHAPQRLFGLTSKGRMAIGYDGDLTIVDMKADYEIRNENMESKCGWTPFHGVQVTAKPVMTVVNGDIAMNNGEILGVKSGKQARFI